MIKKVCLLSDSNTDDMAEYFTKMLAEAMERKGIDVQLIDATEENIDPDVFQNFKANPPDLTCSFSRIEKLSSGKYLWDFLEIPHVAFLLDPPIYSLGQTNSSYIILTCVDRSDAIAAQSIFPRVLHWPHAVKKDFILDNSVERNIDVAFFGGFIDFVGLRKEWKKKLTEQFSWVLDFAIDIALINSSITLPEALSISWETAGMGNAFGQDNFLLLYHYFEQFMIGKDRFELINAIRGPEIHVYGDPLDRYSSNLSDLFPHSNIVSHPHVNYVETIEILKRSKICINSAPSFRDGTHDKIFAGLACGALSIASDSKYLSETFVHGEDILFYKANHWLEVNEWIKEFLADEDRRLNVVSRGREKVMEHHTWDARVDQLLNELPPILAIMPHHS